MLKYRKIVIIRKKKPYITLLPFSKFSPRSRLLLSSSMAIWLLTYGPWFSQAMITVVPLMDRVPKQTKKGECVCLFDPTVWPLIYHLQKLRQLNASWTLASSRVSIFFTQAHSVVSYFTISYYYNYYYLVVVVVVAEAAKKESGVYFHFSSSCSSSSFSYD